MKILSASQIRSTDEHTIATEPISSIDLMERAAIRCTEWLVQHVSIGKQIIIFCGTGNNGGDGLAIARLLKAKWFMVSVVILRAGKASANFESNKSALYEVQIPVVEFSDFDSAFDISAYDVIVDAIFGTGLSRPVGGWIGEWIQTINSSGKEIISIDLPSGLHADEHSDRMIIKAAHTLVFEQPRFSFFFPENNKYVGEFHVLKIGLDHHFIESLNCLNETIEAETISALIKIRNRFSHKGNFGHSLLVAGSKGKVGAAVLAAKGCLRSGTGLLTVHVPACGYAVLQIAVPEAMTTVDDLPDHISKIIKQKKINAVAIGPGLGMHSETAIAVLDFIAKTEFPLILDADALNILSENKKYYSSLPGNSILTPHVKEFERLTQRAENDFHRHELQVTFSKVYRVYIVLKGAYTCITTPEGKSFFNLTGNPGMAKGGSGDVLTGILLGLAAQSYSNEDVCKIGVYIHGRAGDLAAEKFGERSMLPSDLIDSLGVALEEIGKKS